MRFSPALLLLPLLGACVATPAVEQPPYPSDQVQQPGYVPPPAPPPASGAFRAPQVLRAPGLEYVIERDADTLVRYFGAPRLDVKEGDVRKLQFAGEPCVLDVFLYPLQPNGTPVATYVEARRSSDGLEVDRASCANALRR